MHRSRLLSMLACAAIASMAFVSSAAVAVAHVVVATYRAFKNVVLDGFKLAAAKDYRRHQVPVLLVQARAFVLRLAKRERPEVSSGWRMCPST